MSESFVYTACPGWGDHEYCAIKSVVRDGRLVRTEPVNYTGPEEHEGYICQKGVMSCRQPYNPKRLTHPLKRAGARGSGQWEHISWDQALDEIAEKLLALRDAYGPESLAMWNLVASVPPAQGLASLLATRFIGLWGATDPIAGYGLDNGPFYAAYFDMGNFNRYCTTDPANFDDAKLLIVWGANPVENQQRVTKHLVEARSRGARIVDVGLLFDATAAFADEFVPVKPGSDPALALCMAHVIVEEGLFDRAFMLEHTVAPFLVAPDGMLARDAAGNYLVWDADADAPCAVTPGVKEIPCANPALEGAFDVGGRRCETAFTKLRAHLSAYTPAYQEQITGVPAACALRLAHEYASVKPSYLIGALGLRYQNQGESYRAFYLLGMLTGNLGVRGGGVTSEMLPSGWPLSFNDAAIAMPHGKDAFKGHTVRQCDFFDDVESGRSKVKALWVVAGNPVHNCPNRSRWIERVLPNLDLVVDVDVWMTDTGEYADYVLPDCMPFERTELVCAAAYNHIVLQEAAIEPAGEAKDPTFLYSELARRVGLGEYFDKTAEEWIELRLQSDQPAIANITPPLTLERLKREKAVRAAVPEVPWNPFWGMDFATPTARLEFYAERLVPVGAQMASYRPPLEAPTPQSLAAGESPYPYQFFSGRQRFFMQSMFSDDPVMAELSGGKPTARINPVDAAREGIRDGDKVEVFNQRGHVVAQMRLDQAIPPGTVQVWFGWRHDAFEEGMYSELIVPLGSRETLDDVADRWWDLVVAQDGVRHGTGTGGLAGLAGAWDTIWDCACDVRKVGE